MTQATPEAVSALRLKVRRLALRGFDDIFWIDELVPTDRRAAAVVEQSDAVRTQRDEMISWTPKPRSAGALVPLSLLHEFIAPDKPSNQRLIDANGNIGSWSLISQIVLAPRKLFVRQAGKRDREVDLSRALDPPVLLSAGAPAGSPS